MRRRGTPRARPPWHAREAHIGVCRPCGLVLADVLGRLDAVETGIWTSIRITSKPCARAARQPSKPFAATVTSWPARVSKGRGEALVDEIVLGQQDPARAASAAAPRPAAPHRPDELAPPRRRPERDREPERLPCGLALDAICRPSARPLLSRWRDPAAAAVAARDRAVGLRELVEQAVRAPRPNAGPVSRRASRARLRLAALDRAHRTVTSVLR